MPTQKFSKNADPVPNMGMPERFFENWQGASSDDGDGDDRGGGGGGGGEGGGGGARARDGAPRRATPPPPTLGPAQALLTATQRRLLALLFGQPGRRFHASELISRGGCGAGAAQRELARLEGAGLVRAQWRGARKQYWSNRDSPVYHELANLVRKTVGLVEPIRAALAKFEEKIDIAFEFEPISRPMDNAPRDIALFIAGRELNDAELDEALGSVASWLGCQFDPLIFDTAELEGARGWFLEAILAQPRMWLLGDERQLTATMTSGP